MSLFCIGLCCACRDSGSDEDSHEQSDGGVGGDADTDADTDTDTDADTDADTDTDTDADTDTDTDSDTDSDTDADLTFSYHSVAWTMGEGFTAFGNFAIADMDSDDDPDILGSERTMITWWENTGIYDVEWPSHEVGDPTLYGYGRLLLRAADLDGDGDMDVLCALLSGSEITWWENTAGDGTDWARHIVVGGIKGHQDAYTVDLDMDEDPDIVVKVADDSLILWWENTAGDASAWAEQSISAATFTEVYAIDDLDGDRDMDIVFEERPQNKVRWLENLGGRGDSWSPHDLGDLAGPLVLVTGDPDINGHIDVLAQTTDSASLWLNSGNAQSWYKRQVGPWPAAVENSRPFLLGDLDADGDIDIFNTNLMVGSPDFCWAANESGDAAQWTVETIAIETEPGFWGCDPPVLLADIDGDADLDIICPCYQTDQDQLVWLENEIF